MTVFSIRDACEADASELARLCTQLGYPASAAEMPARLARLAGDADARTLVAQRGDDILAVETVHIRYTLNHSAPLAQITLLVVDERARGTGVGRAMVAAAEAWATERHCSKIVVTTALERAGAQAFYETVGYAHTGRRYNKDFPHSK